MQIAGHLDKYLAPPAIYTAFPAGGGGDMRGKILRSAGLKAGFPDIWIMCGSAGKPSVFYQPGSGLYMLELKTLTGVLSAAQKAIHAAIRETLPGAQIEIARTLEEAQRWFECWRLPRREFGRAEGYAHGIGTQRLDEITVTRRTPFNDDLPDFL
jgi:hypothetical protein